MKRWYLFLIILTLSIHTLLATDPIVVTNGMEYMKNKQFQKAIDEFQLLERQGNASLALFQNIGFAYASLHNNPLAILYYEKALKYEPNNRDLLHDLSIIKSKIPALDEDIPPFFLMKYWTKFIGMAGSNFWSFLSILSACLMGVFIFYSFPNWAFSTKQYAVLLILIGIMIISGVAASSRSQQILHSKKWIILNPETHLKSGPDDISPSIDSLPAGSKVIVQDSIEKWIKVASVNGDSGWIRAVDARQI